PAEVSAWRARMAAMATKGALRRTTTRVREAGCEPVPGNTPVASPPLAGWKVRRAQSLGALVRASAALNDRRSTNRQPSVSCSEAAQLDVTHNAAPGRRTQPPRLSLPWDRDRRTGEPAWLQRDHELAGAQRRDRAGRSPGRDPAGGDRHTL